MKGFAFIVYLLLQIIIAMFAWWQVMGLLPALDYFSSFNQVTPGMWVLVGIKVFGLVVAILFFFLIKHLYQKLRVKLK